MTVNGSTLVQYVAPRADDLVALFRVDLDGVATMVAVNPYIAEIVSSTPQREGWYDYANDIHDTLLSGGTGDRMIEIAASLTMVLIVTGMYPWWPRRPSKAGRLAAPPMPCDMPLWQGAVLVGLALSLAFPMAGITLVTVLALDYLVISRIPVLRRLGS